MAVDGRMVALAFATALAVSCTVCESIQGRLYRLRATDLLPSVTPAAIFSHVNSRLHCVKACAGLLNVRCCAVGFSAERKECHAHSDSRAGDVTSAAPGYVVLSSGLMGDSCSADEDCIVDKAVCLNNKCTCATALRYSVTFRTCLNRLGTCQDYFANGLTTSGIYSLQLGDGLAPIDVFCDMTADDGGWVVIQRRQDGSVDFYRNWTQFEDGFGDLQGEFWLGNENIHRLTSAGPKSLRIDLQDSNGVKTHALYSSFSIGNASSLYKLSVSGYSGNAGDCLWGHNGQNFSTPDQDNDASPDHCAEEYGAWWSENCNMCNLNGVHKIRDGAGNGQNFFWINFRVSHSLMRIK